MCLLVTLGVNALKKTGLSRHRSRIIKSCWRVVAAYQGVTIDKTALALAKTCPSTPITI